MTDAGAQIFYIEDSALEGRLDKVLSELNPDISRSHIKKLIDDGHVSVNGKAGCNASRKLAVGDVVEMTIPDPVPYEPEAEEIPLDILYEDKHVLVLNKQAGLVVHPGAGNRTGTLVNALLYHCGDSLSGIGGVLRPGIVHRLDKDTTGLMVVAKSDKAHQGLAAQLEQRSLKRLYQALVLGVPTPLKGQVDQAIGRHPRNRLKMTVRQRSGKEARTFYHVLESYGESCSHVECRLESGRTHQIRVHMEFMKHPLIGDPLYGPQANALQSALKKEGYEADIIAAIMNFSRPALHAKAINFVHPVTEEEMVFDSGFPDDLSNLLKLLKK